MTSLELHGTNVLLESIPSWASSDDQGLVPGSRPFQRLELSSPYRGTTVLAVNIECLFAPCSEFGAVDATSPVAFFAPEHHPDSELGGAYEVSSVADDLEVIRTLTSLSVVDIARLCGVKRRQLYNLMEGEPTEPHRAARIHKLRIALERWAKRLPNPLMLRSALFAPLDSDQRDFVTMVEAKDGHDLSDAVEAFESYLWRLGSGRPIVRTGGPGAHAGSKALQHLLELHGD